MAERIKFCYGTPRIKPKFEQLNLRAFGVKFDGWFLVFIFSKMWVLGGKFWGKFEVKFATVKFKKASRI
ncbi:hypothetical protein [Campylobacter showae]|uniref:hypothetical protein n=1 Tax=Campylobacter showae TaxID=204 RepID=UPI0012FDFB75|nr:hypothetical protein [Campylobacter showae]